MVLQNQTFVQQNFENTFFHLLKLHNQLVSELDLRKNQSGVVLANCRECFLLYYERLENYIITSCGTSNVVVTQADLETTIEGYIQFFDDNQNSLENYFRSLYQLLHFVDRSDVALSSSYAQVIIAQLSSHALTILFYAGLNKSDGIRIKYFIEKLIYFKI